MIKNLLFLSLTLFCLVFRSQNFVASYNFANVTNNSGTIDPTPSPTVAGISFGSFSAIGVSPNPNAGGRLTYTSWPTGATTGIDTYASFTGSLTSTSYYEVIITPQPSVGLNLSTLKFAMRRSGTGIRNYAVRSSIDNFTSNLSASTGANPNLSVVGTNEFFWNFDVTSNTTDQRGSTITFSSSPSFSLIVNPVTLRFYAWNAEGKGGTFSIDSVVFIGSTEATTLMPTPVYIALNNLETKNKSIINLYPNPTNGEYITIESPLEILKIEIINVLGDCVFSQSQTIKSHTIILESLNLTDGLYFVKNFSEIGTETKRLVIKN
jgi:hypothetical protein